MSHCVKQALCSFCVLLFMRIISYVKNEKRRQYGSAENGSIPKKRLRNEKGLTQEQLAEKFGVARRTVSCWEVGSNLPDIDILIEMSDFYEVEIKELLNGERKNEQMDSKEKETALLVADYNIEKNMKNAKIAIGFFVAGLVGVIMGIFFKYVDIGHTFLSGLVRGVCDGVAPAAMIVGLCFTYTIIKRFREEKARIMDAK